MQLKRKKNIYIYILGTELIVLDQQYLTVVSLTHFISSSHLQLDVFEYVDSDKIFL